MERESERFAAQENTLPAVPESARQRAATLMAGATAGAQGQVRVWGPRKLDLWIRVAAFVVFALVYLFGFPKWGVRDFLQLYLWGALILGGSIAALYRPCYITTDDAGIGVTTWKGSRALRWTQIRSMTQFRNNSGQTSLKLGMAGSAEGVDLNLAGYPARVRDEFLALLRKRADLVRVSDSSRYVRVRDVPLETGCYNSLGVILGHASDGGLALLALAPGSPAGLAGLLPGDEILEINDQPTALLNREHGLPWQPGATVTVLFRRTRGDSVETIRRRVATRPLLDSAGKLKALAAPPVSNAILLSREPEGRLIVAAMDLNPSSAAMKAGIQPGDEILDINGFPPDTISLEQARAELSGPSNSIATLIVRDGAAPNAPPRSVVLRLK